MHELSITEHILQIALKHAQDANAIRITEIHLVIGDLSSFIDESIQFYWDILSANTLAYGAVLHFRRIPATFVCDMCGEHFLHRDVGLICPSCGGYRITIIAGREFYVEGIAIESAVER